MATAAPKIRLETQERDIKFAFRITASVDKRFKAAVRGKARGVRTNLLRRGIDLAMTEFRAGRRPAPTDDPLTQMATLNLTKDEFEAIRSATPTGSREDMTSLVRLGVELALATPVTPRA